MSPVRRPSPLSSCRFGAVIAAVAALASSCCTAQSPDKLPESAYPGKLRAPDALGDDAMWRQRVTAKWGKSSARSFETVLQKRGDTLTVLGLSPTGQVGFTIILKAGKITFENRSGIALPFPPRFILLDVQRTFWPWLGPAPGESGERVGNVDDERVIERWNGEGRLTSREFERADGKPQGRIRVRYSGWEPGQRAPKKAVLDNGWFDYVLIVETYEQETLSAETTRLWLSTSQTGR